mmetsp:Transcript_49300/g.94220  ORF Transcript_49300/g.94220 Transcript_49300/m.94220 type:complete len:138 (+) Transcript_49300:259-672(+)
MERALFEECVRPLIRGLLAGQNATVLAYGHTGSGKTHVMGTAFKAGGEICGVTPRAVTELFAVIAEVREAGKKVTVRAGFIEIYKEKVRDLLAPDGSGVCKTITIRETQHGGILLAGGSEEVVDSLKDVTLCLNKSE